MVSSFHHHLMPVDLKYSDIFCVFVCFDSGFFCFAQENSRLSSEMDSIHPWEVSVRCHTWGDIEKYKYFDVKELRSRKQTERETGMWRKGALVHSATAGTSPTDSTFNFNSLWILFIWRELQLALSTNVLQRETFHSDTLSTCQSL